jgi:cytochrome oxidase Cu insertion factor (SCO1/SenC/PrrC family)
MILKLPRRPLSGGRQAAGPAGQGRQRGRARLQLLALGLAMVLVGVAAAAATYLLAGPPSATQASQLPRPSGIPANMSTRLANLMEASALPYTAAPGFTLTDQAGHSLPLASLRGKVVVLEFMDPHCTDICPIVSQEFVDAYHELGPLASKVVFAAVNVNQYYASPADMAAYSRAHQLTTIPGWRFFTGPAPRLQAVWRDYHIAVSAPDPNADIQHTSAVYFIDPQGRERYLASPMVDHTRSGTSYLPIRQIGEWGHGIAVLARDLAG